MDKKDIVGQLLVVIGRGPGDGQYAYKGNRRLFGGSVDLR
jgi:hypothetical protein